MESTEPVEGGILTPNYTQIPNVLIDWLMAELPGAELKVALYIARRTFGFHADSAEISLSQFERGLRNYEGEILDRGTGLSSRPVREAIKSLEAKGIIICERRPETSGPDKPTVYTLIIPPITSFQH
jgi:hypothetical protein